MTGGPVRRPIILLQVCPWRVGPVAMGADVGSGAAVMPLRSSWGLCMGLGAAMLGDKGAMLGARFISSIGE